MNQTQEDANEPKNVEPEPGNLETKSQGSNNRSLESFWVPGILVVVCGLLVLVFFTGRASLSEPKTQIIWSLIVPGFNS
jgi:hypothetical protein